MIARQYIQISGMVQGVGFRPFVFHLAQRFRLAGWVKNDARGVQIDIEGTAEALAAFVAALRTEAPPLSMVDAISIEDRPVNGATNFTIRPSPPTTFDKFTLISPDVALCPDCLQEFQNPADRRFHYPFINCTNCGPRFTIIRELPYDRHNTTMTPFVMCEDCQREYSDPANRRFHAQPNACPLCGPTYTLLTSHQEKIDSPDLFDTVRAGLKAGKIYAIKGIGGYHLICDAGQETAVARLRQRKIREEKPFAMMAASVDWVEKKCILAAAEKQLLTSIQRPIVLLRPKNETVLAPAIAPGQAYWGVMLPYAPVHYLLFDENLPVLVFTSGNQHDEPMAFTDAEAFATLAAIADYFLIHNRSIYLRCDDSVARVVADQPCLLRRARGYAPAPIRLPFSTQSILACGAELKNTFCFTRDRFAFLSQHIGDLENVATLTAFELGIEHFKKMFNRQPEIIAFDLHPGYLATQYAQRQLGLQPISVQHHHAHIAAAMAENQLPPGAAVIGVACDGTGYGTDDAIWGGEFLVATYQSFQRIGHLEYAPMPGGTQCIKEPWRMAASILWQCFGPDFLNWELDFTRHLDRSQWAVIQQALEKKINTPHTSSLGRLFDAVAALTGIRHRVTYEGQAAIELEMCADTQISSGYPCDLRWNDRSFTIPLKPILTGIITDLKKSLHFSKISAKFHHTIIEIMVNACLQIRAANQLNQVVLSGGVFQNVFLLTRLLTRLRSQKFQVYSHHLAPTNDGGISLGQAVIADQKFRQASVSV